ncbi:hypothetical protein IAD21_06044 [Abditibacteriota bacterium]|nr:hypothetical protein IAD21_06044 [Abditibacteriota bacterium]
MPANPKVRPGYQTQLFSPDYISPEAINEVEARLFYAPLAAKTSKKLFFQTSAGLIVVAHVVPLDLCDDHARSGAILGHALFLSTTEFLEIANNPFALLSTDVFIKRIEEVEGQWDTGQIPPLSLDISSPEVQLPGGKPEVWQQLILMATRAPRMLAERQAIAFSGSPDGMEEWLKYLFSLLPISIRIQCTFDTLFTGGTLGRLPYWAVGLETNSVSPQFLQFDLEGGCFADSSQTVVPPIPLWQRVLFRQIERGVIPPNLDAIRGEQFPSPQFTISIADSAPHNNSADLDSASLYQRVQDQLNDQVGRTLGAELLPSAQDWVVGQGTAALTALTDGFPLPLLMGWFTGWATNSVSTPGPLILADWEKFLANLARELPTSKEVQMLRLMFWRWKQNWAKLTETLRGLPTEEFVSFTEWSLKTVPFSAEWVIDSHESTLTFGPCISVGRKTKSDGISHAGYEKPHDTLVIISCLFNSAFQPALVVPTPKFKSWPSLHKRDELSSSRQTLISGGQERLLWLTQRLTEESTMQ